MKKYIILISAFAFFSSNALAEVATTSDSCATISLEGPDADPGTSYYVYASGTNNIGNDYTAQFYVDEQLKDSSSSSAIITPLSPLPSSSFNKSYGPFENGHSFKLMFETNNCKRSVEFSVKSIDPKKTASNICSSISGLPNSAFKSNPSQHKKAFCSKTSEVVSLISSAEASTSDSDKSQYYQQAIDKLQNDIAAKMDGSSGGQSSNDWITDQTSQTTIHQSVTDLIDVLEGLK